MIAFIRKHLLLTAFFLFLGVCLFLGDGQQMLVDTVGAGGVLVLFLIAFLYEKRERELPFVPAVLWGTAIFYFIIRTIFSDDVGFSVYSTIRLIDVFLIFYLFYCYCSDEDRRVIPGYILGFSIFSLFISIMYMFIPALAGTLPKTNLLVPTYGHNNIVDILLFGIPIALLSAIQSKKSFYFLISLFLLLGIFLSFARGVMIIVSFFIILSVLLLRNQISLKKRIAFGILTLAIIGILSVLIAVPQTTYQKHLQSNILPHMAKQAGGANNRFEYFRQALVAIKERPFFGSGPGTFILQSKRLQSAPDSYSRHAHNFLLEQLTEVGSVGTTLLLLIGMWWVITVWRTYRKLEGTKRLTLVILGSGIMLQTLNASIDFSLNFFIIFMLYGACMAIMVSFGKPDTHTKSLITSGLLLLSISLIFVFYLITSICSISSKRRIPFVSSCCLLSEFIATDFLKNSERQIAGYEQDVIQLLHKKNPDVLFAYAKGLSGEEKISFMSLVLLGDPKNRNIYSNFFQIDRTGYILPKSEQFIFLSRGFLTPSLYKNAELLVRSIDENVFSDVSMDFSGEKDMNSFLAKTLYALGLQFLASDFYKTRDLWTLSVKIDPSLSYYSVELASLYATVFQDEKKSYEQLRLCLDNHTAHAHCFMVLEDIQQNGIRVLPQIGSFKDLIAKMQ